MIYTGSNEILGIKLGNDEISAIYASDLLIYPTTVTGWSVNPSSIEVKKSSGTATIRIASLSPWTISSSESWITFSQNSGESGRTSVIVTFGENETGVERYGTITATDGVNVSNISVTQNAEVDYITITYNSASTYFQIFGAYSAATGNFNAMRIDGGDWTDLPETEYYTFSDSGKHIVDYRLKDTSILQYPVFRNCSAITDVNMEKCPIVTLGNTTISDGASQTSGRCFSFCSNLTGVTFPTTLQYLGSEVFCQGPHPKVYKLPASLTRIGHYTFSPRTEASAFNDTTTIIIGDPVNGSNLTGISMCMFELCNNITDIYSYAMVNATNEYMWSNFAFFGIAKNGTLHTPPNSNYSKWMGSSSYWLGSSGWTRLEDL